MKHFSLKNHPASTVWGGLIALMAGDAAGNTVFAHIESEKSSQNNTKRTFEAFEGRANAEVLERALGDHDLDK